MASKVNTIMSSKPTLTKKTTATKATSSATATKATLSTETNSFATTAAVVAAVTAVVASTTATSTTKVANNYSSAVKSFDIHNNKYIEEPWTIIESYFKDHHLERLVRHQLESYNHFVGYQMMKTIEMFNPLHIKPEDEYNAACGKHALEIVITFSNLNIYRPQIHENNGSIKLMFPQEARLRNFTYASVMTIDINIKYIIRDGENLENVQTLYKTLPKIHIGKLPIMLKSNICVLNQYNHINNKHTGECKYDAGGYFIINGSEKTVLGQERAAENRVYCFNVSKNDTKYTWKAEIKSVPDFKCISPKQLSVMMSSKNNGFGFAIVAQIPRVKQPIPLFILFRALGILTDRDICEYILLNISEDKHAKMLEMLTASIIEANKHMSQEAAFDFIKSNVSYVPTTDTEHGKMTKLQFVQEILKTDLFPHCQTRAQKIYFLGYMVNKLLQVSFEWIKPDDRDSYLNKRIDLTGTSLNNLFRNYFNKLVKDMEKQIVKEVKTGSWRSKEDYLNIINLTNIYKIVKSTTIENGFKRALSTGDFGIKHTNSNKVGVAQVLNRLTYVASLSHLRRISTPTDKSGKLVPPRRLHNTSWGFICPAESPEGASVGVIKNISYMAHLTIASNSTSLYDYVLPDIVPLTDECQPLDMYNKVKVFINGCWVGVSLSPEELYAKLKTMKHQGIINIYTSVIFDFGAQEIRVCNDAGRLTRPLLRVKDKNLLLSEEVLDKLKNDEMKWDDLLINSADGIEAVIEYVDPEEQSFSMIATKPHDIVSDKEHIIHKFTHCEIHPSTIFGVVASCIPFPDHNQSPRNTYQCLALDEQVLMANGASKCIKDVVVGDRVVSFNPDTLDVSYTTVVNQYVRKTDKPVYRLTTASGESIVATFDHKFMTTDGWTTVEDMVENQTQIGLKPCQKALLNECGDESIVLDHLLVANASPVIMHLDIPAVEDILVNNLKLLPLRANDTRLPIIARLFGFTMASHWMSNESCVYPDEIVWQFESETDLTRFQNDLTECFGHYGMGRKHVEILLLNLPGFVSLFMRSLSVVNRYSIPSWIRNGSALVKREFLAGFNSTDICKVCDVENYMTLDAKVVIVEEYNKVTSDFGVIFADVNGLSLSGDISAYTENIGFRYSREKSWLLYCMNLKCELSCKEVSNMVFVPIVSKVLVDNVDVSDITVESENHSFITTGGILSSNCAQAKQAMGIYATNFTERMDKTAYVLTYPTRPLVDTRVMNLIKLNENPSGCNVTVAIMTHTGYNQEDSLIINKGAIDRGLLQITINHTEKDEDKQKTNGDEEIRCKPDPAKTKGMKMGNYGKVNSKGIMPENTLVENRDIIIAKVTPIKENRNDPSKVIKYEDCSRQYKTNEETYIDRNYINKNGDGYNVAKVRLRTLRKPVIGDKFSSRHGQKGTAGNIVPEEDMPFTSTGERADIIINPHAIPSRMTIGHTKETLLGQLLVQLGLFGDGTSFGELDVSMISNKLLELGCEAHGNKLYYSGLTGEQLECSVFVGPIFYQRLKHMVNDKQHSRSNGPMVNLTRQPNEGRGRDGGHKFGEMERDCMISHGAANFTRGRMYFASDKYSMYFCKKCGLHASYNDALHIHQCFTCDNRTDFAYVEIPYSCKLLFQELITMNVVPRVIT